MKASKPEIYVMLSMGLTTKEIIAQGYSPATVYLYYTKWQKAKKNIAKGLKR